MAESSDGWKKFIEDPEPWTPPVPLPGPLQTARTVVRLYQPGDGPRLFAAIDQAREPLFPQMVWAYTDHQQVDDSIHYVESSRRKVDQPDCRSFPLGIFDRQTGELLGGTGLHSIESGRRQAEVGYWIRGDRHGEGLCTEAAAAVITAAVSPVAAGGWGLRRIVVFTAATNTASRHVCEKLGLRLEMRLKQERYFGPPGVVPGYVDVVGFAVLANEWDADKQRARPGIAWT